MPKNSIDSRVTLSDFDTDVIQLWNDKYHTDVQELHAFRHGAELY
jgi:hypothetical protein